MSSKQNTSFVIISANMLNIKLQGIVLDLSMMRISYKLTKRTTKIEKIEKNPTDIKSV